MEIKGYKAFNKDIINRYGKKFELGKSYHVDGKSKFGNNGNGFHFCEHFEDTFRYFDKNEEIILCEVTGFGDISTYNDEYYGYYDMHASSDITINRIIEREEIIQMADALYEERFIKFVSTYNLNKKELLYFKEKYSNIVNIKKTLIYYYK